MNTNQFISTIIFLVVLVSQASGMESDIEIVNKYLRAEKFELIEEGLAHAIRTAKASKNEFLSALRNPKPQQSTFMVLTATNSTTFWATAERESDTINTSSIAISEAGGILNGLSIEEILDWCFVDNGLLKGGYSIRHLFEKMPLTSRKQDIESGLSFFIPPLQFDWDDSSIGLMQLIGYNDVEGVRRFVESNRCRSIKAVTRRPLSRKLVDEVPLNYAVMYSNLAMVKCLESLGFDINDSSFDGITPLFTAASVGMLETVRYLCQQGANINANDERGLTPLAIAVINNHESIADFLLDSGASTSCVDEDGSTLLHLVASDNVLLAEKLIALGTPLNHLDAQGDTVLHCAAINGFPDILRYLVSKGASLNSRNNSDESPLDLVRNNPKLGEVIASELIEISRKQSKK